MKTKTLYILGGVLVGGYLIYKIVNATVTSAGNVASQAVVANAPLAGAGLVDGAEAEVGSQLSNFANTVSFGLFGSPAQQPAGGMPTG